MKSLGVILARGGSKRLPRKNVRPLAGLPLAGWTCRAARASQIDRVILSTEDDEITQIGRDAGIDVPFRRPDKLAADYARDVDIILHALDQAQNCYEEDYDVVVMIQATTPFVRPADLTKCVEKLRSGNYACVFTARKAEDHPRWTWKMDADGAAQPYMGTTLQSSEQHGQNLDPAYYPSGAAWAIRTAALRTQDQIYCTPLAIVVMAWQHSIDIDDERDWVIAEAIAREYQIMPEPVRCSSA